MTTLSIKKIKVMINQSGTDTIYVEPDADTSFPIMGFPSYFKMEAQAGYGVEWVKKTFNREPDEIIDMKQ